MAGTLFLLPCPIAQGTRDSVLPAGVMEIARGVTYFLAENAKSARAFLKEVGHPRPLREVDIVEIGHAPGIDSAAGWLEPVLHGRDAALVSEAGAPAVADPGAIVVSVAHQKGIRVRPLVGPSAILLALMAAGLNGQQFRFHGYLPVAPAERTRCLLALERDARRGETQMFIETPYRSRSMFEAILAACEAHTRLSLAADLTGPSESVMTMTIAGWRVAARPLLERRPAVFSLLG